MQALDVVLRGGQENEQTGVKWERVRDEDTGDWYEYNTTTEETRWVDDDGSANVKVTTEDHGTSIGKGWERFLDETTGDWFECHTVTGETRWVEDSVEDFGRDLR